MRRPLSGTVLRRFASLPDLLNILKASIAGLVAIVLALFLYNRLNQTPRSVLVRHALLNMLIPVITVIGLQLGHLLGGAVIVETVFAWPGVGRLLVEAIGNRDYPLIQATILFITAGFVLINFLVDLSYGAIDPRVRLG